MLKVTRDKYLLRLTAVRLSVMRWINEVPGREEELTELYNKVRQIENDIIDGVETVTLDVSNRINVVEASAARIKRQIAGEPEVTEDVPAAEPVPPVTEMGEYVLEELREVQARLLDLYGKIIEKHPIAAELPVVEEIRQHASAITLLMQRLNKVAGVL